MSGVAGMTWNLTDELRADVRDVLESNYGLWLTANHVGEILSWPVGQRIIRQYLGDLEAAGLLETRIVEGHEATIRIKQWRWSDAGVHSLR